MALTLDVFRPPGTQAQPNCAAIIHLQSDGLHTSHGQPENFELALARGHVVFRVMHNAEPKFTLEEQLDDLQRAVRYIRYHAADHGVDANRLGIEGASSGGHMTLLTAYPGRPGDPAALDAVDRADS